MKNKYYKIKTTNEHARNKKRRIIKKHTSHRRAALIGFVLAIGLVGLVTGSVLAISKFTSDGDFQVEVTRPDEVIAESSVPVNETEPEEVDEQNEDEPAASEVETQPTAEATVQQSAAADSATVKTSYPNPFAGKSIFVGSHDPAGDTAASWSSSNPSGAAALNKISGNPIAIWLTRGTGNLSSYVSSNASNAASEGAVPVFVVYGMPGLSCAQAASGASDYIAWVESIDSAVGDRAAVYILEPDELAIEQCGSSEADRYAVVKQAAKILSSNSSAAVYIDAGHGRWVDSSTMATRLRDSGIEYAQGFALNVSNYETTAVNTSYGNTLSSELGGVHYVIDTSRNGLGPTADNEWCNAPGRALGERPVVKSGVLDALLWIKYPGESDLACNGGPAEGQWWAEYAVGLAERASW